MNLTIVLSLAFALIGAVVYLISGQAKVAEIGRLSFACGLLAFLLTLADRILRLTA